MFSTKDKSIAYRPDVDGLRAVAVMSVVLYHAFPTRLPGGFIGVDIFFVISGYLISSILYSELAERRFSFQSFYARRIRRLFPSLVLVLLATCLFGWFTLLPAEYMQLGKHVLSAASFMSNFVFWSESGYFDSESSTKLLLHLWSLGIEEQFYIFWPLILWLASRYRVSFAVLISALFVLSLGLSIREVFVMRQVSL